MILFVRNIIFSMFKRGNIYWITIPSVFISLLGHLSNYFGVKSGMESLFTEKSYFFIFFIVVVFAGSIIAAIDRKKMLDDATIRGKDIIALQRQAKYGEAIDSLRKAFSKIHHLNNDLNDDLKGIVNKSLITDLKEFCDDIADVFTEMTDSKCSVCIKVAYKDVEMGYCVKTLVRDKGSYDRANNDAQQKQKKHPFVNNTDFSRIFNRIRDIGGEAFLCNDLEDLARAGGYSSTSSLNNDLKNYYDLPYNSTIVSAICPDLSKNQQDSSDLIVGFLCVDSPKKGEVFKDKWDKSLMIGAANGIYNTLLQSKKRNLI